MKHKKIRICIIITIILITAISLLLFVYQKKEQEKLKQEKKELVEKIKKHYSSIVEVSKDTALYQKKNGKYTKVGEISKGEKIRLKEQKITHKTKYFYLSDIGYYISYSDVSGYDGEITNDDRYKKYLLFNENIVTKDKVSLMKNDKVSYTLNFSIDTPIIQKEDNGYYIEYFNQLWFVSTADVEKTYEKENTKEEEATEVAVTVYHFIYLEGDSSCKEMICHPEKQIKEQFQYLKENQYFTLTTKELRQFIEGKIRIPKKSVLVTIDDGARAEHFVPLLEEYQINATLFLVSSWYPKEKFQSSYMEIASHTHNLHTPGVCPGGQGSPLKCLDKEKLVADLVQSRNTLDGTEAFCFPFYEFNDYGIEALKEAGFKMGFIGGMKKATKNTNLYKIPRISMNHNTTLSQYINYIN